MKKSPLKKLSLNNLKVVSMTREEKKVIVGGAYWTLYYRKC